MFNPAYSNKNYYNCLKKVIEHYKIKSVLELGAGLFDNLRFLENNFKDLSLIGIEVYKSYIEKKHCSSKVVTINANIEDIENIWKKKVFLKCDKVDCILLIDVIEHLEKEKGFKLLEYIEKICNKVIVLFSPEGYAPQDKDTFQGFNNDYYQTHRSQWYKKDFDLLGYDTAVWVDYHKREKNTHNAMFIVKEVFNNFNIEIKKDIKKNESFGRLL